MPSRQSINPIWAQYSLTNGLIWTRFKTTKTTVPCLKKLEKSCTLELSGWQIRVSWVKAHTGIDGKDFADKVAKEAAQS